MLRATTACTFSTSQLPTVLRSWCVLYVLTSKCASRHNRRALFRHLNFQNGVFCTFWLRNVLRPTVACSFSTSQLLKSLQSWGFLYILTSACASRHNGVQFFISHLARWFRTCRFSEPTFRPFEAANHWNTQWIATFLPFRALASSFFWLFLLSDLLSSFLLLSDSSRLCYSICPYCRKFDFETSFDQSIKTIENQTKTNPNTNEYPDYIIETRCFSQPLVLSLVPRWDPSPSGWEKSPEPPTRSPAAGYWKRRGFCKWINNESTNWCE